MSDDVVVIVPGITGSVLAHGQRELWSLSAAALRRGVLHTSEVLDQLRLPPVAGDPGEYAGLALESPEVIRGLHVWPGFWAGSGYGTLIDRLNKALPGRVLTFAYDWRLPNAYTASRLQRFVEKALQRFPGSKVTFVCHSMGGLITRYYLEVLGGSTHAARLITIGTPFSGSVKAVKALSGGLFPRIPGLGERVARVARTFPAVAELLPTYRCVDTGPGAEPLRLTEIEIPGLATETVLRGRRFHDELNAAVARNNGSNDGSYALHVFAGKLQATDQSIAVNGAGIAFQRSQRGIDHAGDGTVSCFSAVPPEWERDEHALFRPAKHGPLAKHRDLLDDVIAKATSRELGAILAPLDELSLHLPEVVAAGEPVELVVTSESANLRLQAGVFDADDNPHTTHIPVRPDASGHRYRAVLTLPPGLWQVRVEEITKQPRAFVEDLVTAL
ncbi:lipase family alpha/beta hydrolase [Nocardia abscessus]|uniref:lipase family alpha/beta hydrolase n=1 Tax=Nocardia abscessus TaxID=120957 RepID=UPI00245743B3|nr:alpha/beta fold hydrolase [Nocardia abscessus]